MTLRTVGVVLSTNLETGEVMALIPSIVGDSGSPLYVVDPDGTAHIVGNLSGGSPLLFNVFDVTKQHTATAGLRL